MMWSSNYYTVIYHIQNYTLFKHINLLILKPPWVSQQHDSVFIPSTNVENELTHNPDNQGQQYQKQHKYDYYSKDKWKTMRGWWPPAVVLTIILIIVVLLVTSTSQSADSARCYAFNPPTLATFHPFNLLIVNMIALKMV